MSKIVIIVDDEENIRSPCAVQLAFQVYDPYVLSTGDEGGGKKRIEIQF